MSDSRRIDINVSGRADLGQAGGELGRFRQQLEQIRTQVRSLGGDLKALAAAGAATGLKQSLDSTRQLTMGSLSGGAMYGRISGGLAQYKQHIIEIDNEARAVKRLGESYRDYHHALIDAGRAYGFSNNQVLGLASMYSQTLGRAGAGSLLDDMQTTQGFARAYGMQATEAGAYLNQANTAGIIGAGGDIASMRQFSGLLADAISAGGMQGREGEVIGSVLDLTRAINAQRVGMQGTTLAAQALTTLNATGIRGLQGEAGAELLGRLDQAIKAPGGGEAGNLFMYQALTGGQGGMNLADYSYLKEEGLAGTTPDGRSNLQAIMEQIGTMPVKGRYRLMAASNLTGMSMHQYEALEGAFMQDGQFDIGKLGRLQDTLGSDMGGVDASVWALLADLQHGGDVGAIGREFAQLSGQTAATSKDALFNQIKTYGQGNVALSEGQQREKLDNDIAKASEDAAAKLYDLQTAADQLAKKLIEWGGALPGPLGGIAPIIAGSAAGGLLERGGSALAGRGADLLGKFFGGRAAAGLGGQVAPTAAGGGRALLPAAGGLGLLGSAATFAGGVGLGTAAAYAGSWLGQHLYGTEAFLGDVHQGAITQGWQNLISGDNSLGDVGNALGGLLLAPAGVIGGTLYGASDQILNQFGLGTGKDFGSAYRDAFFSIDPADSAGRRQWLEAQQAMQGGGGSGWGMPQPEVPIASSRGGWWDVPDDDMPTLLHRREMVLPAYLADPLRQSINGPQLSEQDARAGAGFIRVEIAPIQVKLPDGSTQTVPAQGQYVPFDGVIAHPIRSAR